MGVYLTKEESAYFDEVEKRKPTRSRHIALRDERPYLPTCGHDGCRKACEGSRGSGKREKYLCSKHMDHPLYKSLRHRSDLRPLIIIRPA